MSTKKLWRTPTPRSVSVLSGRVWTWEGWFGPVPPTFSRRRPQVWNIFPGRTPTLELGPPGRVPFTQLCATPVDFLMIDLQDFTGWERWLEQASQNGSIPRAVVQALPPEYLSDGPKETELHLRGKRLKRLGYTAIYWYLRAHEFGAALHQDRLFMVYYLEGRDCLSPIQPKPDGLPGRSMANLLVPVGVPHGAFLNGAPVAQPMPSYQGPCQLWGRCGPRPIYSIDGVIPDNLTASLLVRNRCRRLQSGELAKAKGVLSEWNVKPARPLPAKPAALGTSLHLWTAVGNSLAVWLQPAKRDDSPTVDDCSLPPPPTSLAGEDKDKFIAWTLPNLARNGPWHRARQVSLKAAVVGLPNASQLIIEGERAIARQAISAFLDCWVETPLTMGAIFLVPRVLQRDWAHISHSITRHRFTVWQRRQLYQRGTDLPILLDRAVRGAQSRVVLGRSHHPPERERRVRPQRHQGWDSCGAHVVLASRLPVSSRV
jgi:hypothetical protein